MSPPCPCPRAWENPHPYPMSLLLGFDPSMWTRAVRGSQGPLIHLHPPDSRAHCFLESFRADGLPEGTWGPDQEEERQQEIR